jgi:hypothetical protein
MQLLQIVKIKYLTATAQQLNLAQTALGSHLDHRYNSKQKATNIAARQLSKLQQAGILAEVTTQ